MDVNPPKTKTQNLLKSPEEMSITSTSYIFENAHDQYYVPNQISNNQFDQDYSPMTPVNLQDRLSTSKFAIINTQVIF